MVLICNLVYHITLMNLPKKVFSRKDEITAEFLLLIDKHVKDLMAGRINRRYHASDFGALLFIHPRHLSNTIKLTTGKSPCDFMEERLYHEAEKLLLESALPIAEIGFMFGYEEPTNFIKFFKSMAGSTPLQFRKRSMLKAE